MKRILTIALAMSLLCSVPCSADTSFSVIGGADGPTAIFLAGKIESDEEEKEISRDQIIFQNEVITYNTEIPESLYIYETTAFGQLPMENPPVKVVTNKNGIIRAFYIMSDEIEMCDGISVGMSVNRITSTYPDAIEGPNMFDVLFDEDGNTVKSEDRDPKVDYLYYSYKIKDDIIELIMICDSTFATTMR